MVPLCACIKCNLTLDSLWNVLGEGEVTLLADYAAAHFETHKRPLRIAVDEACWRFTNLNVEQVARIREGEQAANPVEKTFLWRILRAYKLNIDLLFVNDGLRKPHKERQTRKGPGGGKLDGETVRLLHRMFRVLKVPHHQAPGEAEAECAKLQRLGIVDAVWSDDCDAFMFGCTTLIKQHKVKGKVMEGQVRIYKASAILEPLGLDVDGLVLFAVLAGGDYDLTGLPRCGHETAKRIVQRRPDLARALKNCTRKEDLSAWRDSLAEVLSTCARSLEIPAHFPKWKAVEDYRRPNVSSDEKCRNLPKGGWTQRIDEQKLRVELRSRYNFNTREYLKHIAPLFLARALRDVTPQKKQENLRFGIELKRTIQKKDEHGEVIAPSRTVNFWYDAASLVGIDLSVQPSDEDWSKFDDKKTGTPYDPKSRIDCADFLLCLLQYGLPDGSLERPARSPKKRKQNAAGDGTHLDLVSDRVETTNGSKGPEDTVPAKRRKNFKEDSSNPKAAPKRKKSATIAQAPTPPRPGFKKIEIYDYQPRPPPTGQPSRVIDLGDSDSEPEVTQAQEKDPLVRPYSTSPSSQQAQNSDLVAQSPARPVYKFKPLRPSKLMSKKLLELSPPPRPKSRKTPLPPKNSNTGSSEQASCCVLPATPIERTVSAPGEDVLPVVKTSTGSLGCSHSVPEAAPGMTPGMTPGATIPAATLRQLRAAALSHALLPKDSSSLLSKSEHGRQSPAHTVIDLT